MEKRELLWNSFEDNETKYIEDIKNGKLIEIDPDGEVWEDGRHIGFAQDNNWISFDNGEEAYVL